MSWVLRAMTDKDMAEMSKQMQFVLNDLFSDPGSLRLTVLSTQKAEKSKKLPMCYGVGLGCPCNDTTCPAYYPIEPWKDDGPDPTVNHQRHPCL